jgi:hypothetical protein
MIKVDKSFDRISKQERRHFSESREDSLGLT